MSAGHHFLKATTLGGLGLRGSVTAPHGHQRALCKHPFCLEHPGAAKKHWQGLVPSFSIRSDTEPPPRSKRRLDNARSLQGLLFFCPPSDSSVPQRVLTTQEP